MRMDTRISNAPKYRFRAAPLSFDEYRAPSGEVKNAANDRIHAIWIETLEASEYLVAEISAVAVMTTRVVPWASCCRTPKADKKGVSSTPPPAPISEPTVEAVTAQQKRRGCEIFV